MTLLLSRRSFLLATVLFAPAIVSAQTPDAGPAAPEQQDMNEPSADASNAVEITLEPRPMLYLQSNALWDDNFVTLQESFAALSKEMTALGLTAKDHPIASYLDTDDAGFTFQAMLMIDGVPPPGRTPSDPRMKFGETPSGKALRFAHTGAFDELDPLYEAITGYLDEKLLTMKTPYLEEYISPLTASDDPKLEMNIYVLIDESKAPPAPTLSAPPLEAAPPADAAPAAPAAPKPATPVPQPTPDAG